MFGLVIVRYISLPMNLLNCVGSFNRTPLVLDNMRFCSIGVLKGLKPANPVSCRISNAFSSGLVLSLSYFWLLLSLESIGQVLGP